MEKPGPTSVASGDNSLTKVDSVNLVAQAKESDKHITSETIGKILVSINSGSVE
jgi:hypothetical protein